MKQTTVRMADEIYQGVSNYADISERSVNGQIVWILKQWLVHQGVINAGLPGELGGLLPTVNQEGSSGNT